jgi:exo-beta-1,3-glucanase (GH17 family)
VARGNIEGILVGNEDPDMIGYGIIPKYLQQAKSDFPLTPVGTSQTSTFWLSDGRAEQLVPLVDFIGVNIYPAWDWQRADANNQPIGVNPETGFNSFNVTYNQVRSKYPGRQIVVTETGWPTTFGPIGSQQFPVGISNARDYLQRVIAWAQAQQVVLYIHNMFDDQFGVNTSSPFNYHFGLIDNTGKPKGILF